MDKVVKDLFTNHHKELFHCVVVLRKIIFNEDEIMKASTNGTGNIPCLVEIRETAFKKS